MEKQKTFIDRLEEDGEEFGAGFVFADCKVCETCMFRYKETPPYLYGDGKDHAYENGNCQIYEGDIGDKPYEVMFKGAECELYEAEE
ncbi:MAG: hypothetical protein LBG74_00725 [Spirochaetaceae bacterium]|jgi:hypothetical protein|nr:hypothetical protein [Spirochaetaceae bacterium]